MAGSDRVKSGGDGVPDMPNVSIPVPLLFHRSVGWTAFAMLAVETFCDDAAVVVWDSAGGGKRVERHVDNLAGRYTPRSSRRV